MTLLAIDDDPGRYDYLRVLIEGRGATLHVASCPACVAEWLPRADAVLLDYDLDGGDDCTCGVPVSGKASAYLPALIERRAPVIITSCSHHDNRLELYRALDRAGARVAGIAADRQGCELEWLGKLWAWGAL